MDYYLNVGEDNDGWYVAKGHEQIMFGLTEENATEVCRLFKTIEQLQVRVCELEVENERLSALCDKWNTECDEYREDNKHCSNELATIIRQRDLAVAELAEKDNLQYGYMENLLGEFNDEYERIEQKYKAIKESEVK